jgi:hypothetical protein
MPRIVAPAGQFVNSQGHVRERLKLGRNMNTSPMAIGSLWWGGHAGTNSV